MYIYIYKERERYVCTLASSGDALRTAPRFSPEPGSSPDKELEQLKISYQNCLWT